MKNNNVLQQLARVKFGDIFGQLNTQKSSHNINNKRAQNTFGIKELKATKQKELTHKANYISRSVRVKVFARDNYQCAVCHRNSQQTQLLIDCIIPFSQGGTKEADNLQTLCVDCNSAKKAPIIPSFT